MGVEGGDATSDTKETLHMSMIYHGHQCDNNRLV